MSLTIIRAEIKTILDSVTALGNVYDYHRWTVRPEQFITLYVTASKINGCSFARRSTAENRETLGPRYLRIYDFGFMVFYGLDDSEATGKFFQDSIIEDICTKFRAKHDLSGKCQKHDLIQVESVTEMMFSDYLVHYAELGLTVYEELNS